MQREDGQHHSRGSVGEAQCSVAHQKTVVQQMVVLERSALAHSTTDGSESISGATAHNSSNRRCSCDYGSNQQCGNGDLGSEAVLEAGTGPPALVRRVLWWWLHKG